MFDDEMILNGSLKAKLNDEKIADNLETVLNDDSDTVVAESVKEDKTDSNSKKYDENSKGELTDDGIDDNAVAEDLINGDEERTNPETDVIDRLLTNASPTPSVPCPTSDIVGDMDQLPHEIHHKQHVIQAVENFEGVSNTFHDNVSDNIKELSLNKGEYDIELKPGVVDQSNINEEDNDALATAVVFQFVDKECRDETAKRNNLMNTIFQPSDQATMPFTEYSDITEAEPVAMHEMTVNEIHVNRIDPTFFEHQTEEPVIIANIILSSPSQLPADCLAVAALNATSDDATMLCDAITAPNCNDGFCHENETEFTGHTTGKTSSPSPASNYKESEDSNTHSLTSGSVDFSNGEVSTETPDCHLALETGEIDLKCRKS